MLLEDMIDRLAVQHRSRAARVVRDHPADSRTAGRGNVWREAQAVRFELRIQIVEHHARLDPGPALGDVEVENAIKVLRGVELKAGADRLYALRRDAAPPIYGHVSPPCRPERAEHTSVR